MKPIKKILHRSGLMLALLLAGLPVWAADNVTQPSSMGSMVKVILGLGVVLAVMALVSWLVKRLLPGGGSQASVLKVVARTGVGSRERVGVLEIADRWLVVGVASGQVSALANLEIGSGIPNLKFETANPDATASSAVHASVNPVLQPLVKPFADWLKKSTDKAKSKF